MTESTPSKAPIGLAGWVFILVVLATVVWLGTNLFSNNSGCVSCDIGPVSSNIRVDMENPSGDCGPGGNDACPG